MIATKTKTRGVRPDAQRVAALSRWDGEGGASPGAVRAAEPRPATEPPHDAERVQMHIRIIALEHLVITLLAAAPRRQLDAARGLAACITPRPGRTRHRLTIHAAARILDVVERADRLRRAAPP